MPIFVVLAHFTDQGIRAASESPKRADAFKAMAKKVGATVKEFFWTLGSYDMVTIIEAPDVETITALSLSIGKLGNVRTLTLRAFNEAEMKGIVKKVV
ncbi:MAG: GYD domain-containing protein [Xanthobacteraceae bacterium]